MLSVKDFSAKIKQKYPQYSSLDDNTLTQKIIEKYPQYKDQVDFGGSSSTEKKGVFGLPAYQSPEEKGLVSPFSEQGIKNIQESTGLAGGIVGAGKGLASTITNASQLGYNLFKPVNNAILGLVGQKVPEMDSTYQNIQKSIEPKNLSQGIGFGAEQLGEFLVPGAIGSKLGTASKVAVEGENLTKGQKILQGLMNLGKTSAKEALGAGAVSTLQQGGINKDVLTTAGIAGALPVVGAVAKPLTNILKEKIPSKLMNSLIKPATKEFSFGKNPGLAVAQEGIKANTLGDLAEKISTVKNDLGSQIGKLAKKAADAGGIHDVQPMINDLAQKASTSLSTEAEKNLWNSKIESLTNQLTSKGGKLVKALDKEGNPIVKDLSKIPTDELHKLQTQIGKMTQWTGEPGEKTVNKLFKELYSNVGKEIDKSTQKFVGESSKALQQRYANLLGAEKAIENRLAVATRNNAVGLNSAIFGTAGALSGNSPEERIKNAIFGALLPKIGGSTALKSRLSSVLAKESSGVLGKLIPAAYSQLTSPKK